MNLGTRTSDALNSIAESIRESKRLGLSDEDITKTFIDPVTHQSTLSFGECSYIDCVLTGDDTHRGFWRSAYGYPSEGDGVTYCGSDGLRVYAEAKDVGLFTFNIDFAEDNVFAPQVSVCECDCKK